jgi:phage shock protein PspC (stress-responsive transcriptional regulator)
MGGVAAGLGDYLGIDPLIPRAVFAGLMIFGGAGLVLYVLAWAVIPTDVQAESIAGSAFRRVGRRWRVIGFVTACAAAIAIGVNVVESIRYGGVDATGFAAAAVIIIGILLLRPSTWDLFRPGAAVWPSGLAGPEPVPTGWPAPAAATEGPWRVAPATSPILQPRERTPRPERSPLGWFVLGAMLLVTAALAIAGNALGLRVSPGQALGVPLTVLGLGLVVGAWWGHARLLILPGLVLLPLAAAGSLVNVPLEGGLATQIFRPQVVQEVRPAYRLVGGLLELDLSALEAGSEPVRIAASVGVGDLVVHVPEGARVEVGGRVGGGRLTLLGGYQVGTGLADRVVVADGRGPTLILDLATGIGRVWVSERPASGGS